LAYLYNRGKPISSAEKKVKVSGVGRKARLYPGRGGLCEAIQSRAGLQAGLPSAAGGLDPRNAKTGGRRRDKTSRQQEKFSHCEKATEIERTVCEGASGRIATTE